MSEPLKIINLALLAQLLFVKPFNYFSDFLVLSYFEIVFSMRELNTVY